MRQLELAARPASCCRTSKLTCRPGSRAKKTIEYQDADPARCSAWFGGLFIVLDKRPQPENNPTTLELAKPNVIEFLAHTSDIKADCRILG
jgi:hypothetical protein